jgi:hypothetical protein
MSVSLYMSHALVIQYRSWQLKIVGSPQSESWQHDSSVSTLHVTQVRPSVPPHEGFSVVQSSFEQQYPDGILGIQISVQNPAMHFSSVVQSLSLQQLPKSVASHGPHPYSSHGPHIPRMPSAEGVHSESLSQHLSMQDLTSGSSKKHSFRSSKLRSNSAIGSTLGSLARKCFQTKKGSLATKEPSNSALWHSLHPISFGREAEDVCKGGRVLIQSTFPFSSMPEESPIEVSANPGNNHKYASRK